MQKIRFVVVLLATLVCTASNKCFSAAVETVLVGNPGNLPPAAPFPTTYGAVAATYRIGTYEVTNAQYVELLNGVDPTGANTLGLYNAGMATNPVGGINFNAGAAAGSKYQIKPGRDNNPVVYVNLFDAMRFTNWLQNGRGAGSTESGAYTLQGGAPIPTNPTAITRNAGVQWFLPTQSQWVKAAYHKNDGATGNYSNTPTQQDAVAALYSVPPPGTSAPIQTSAANMYIDDRNGGIDTTPGNNNGYAVTGSFDFDPSQNYLTNVGAYAQSVSAYGTFDQAGNVSEWVESAVSPTEVGGDPPGSRGGNWRVPGGNILFGATGVAGIATQEFDFQGFRVASSIGAGVVRFFTNDPTGFAAAKTGAIPLGVETFEENNSPSGNVAINDSLTAGVANGVFTSGLDHPITLQSNMSGGNPASPNPRGTSGLRLWNAGSGGAASDYVTAGNVDATTRVDSLDIILNPADRIRAVSFNPIRTNVAFPVEVRVYDTDNNLLEEMTSVAADPAGTNFVGIVATAGELIGRINIYAPVAGPEGADNIALFAAGIPGDYNIDGKVDAADYTVWRDTLGTNVARGSGADGNGNGNVGPEDFTVWREHFGTSAGSGSSASQAVPEPASISMLIAGVAMLLLRHSDRRSLTITAPSTTQRQPAS
jgi:formylglycine-generating enzyme required for sulfatase activity